MMNRRQLLVSLASGAIAGTVMFFGGCASSTTISTWINMGLSLISTVLPTLPAIIAAFGSLIGKTVLSTAQITKLQTIFTGIGNLFAQAEAALTSYEANADASLITDIQTILNSIKTSLSSVLTDVQVTDPATVTKITSIVNSFLDLANNILAILPIVTTTSGGATTLTARKVSRAQIQKVTAAQWASDFNKSISAPCGNPAIDDAFAGVKAVPHTVN